MIYLAKKKNKNMTQEVLEQLKELNEKLIKLSDALDRLIYSEMELIEKLKRKESNLPHKESCLVYGDTCVYSDAWVIVSACIYGSARVYGNALSFGDALISKPIKLVGGRFFYIKAY
jgi:hypothetical protein